MKTEINETTWGLDITLTAETPSDVAKLFRYANNAKKEKPSVSLSFGSDEPKCNIYLSKVNESVQKNYVQK